MFIYACLFDFFVVVRNLSLLWCAKCVDGLLLCCLFIEYKYIWYDHHSCKYNGMIVAHNARSVLICISMPHVGCVAFRISVVGPDRVRLWCVCRCVQPNICPFRYFKPFSIIHRFTCMLPHSLIEYETS